MQQIIENRYLRLPHPGMHERDFVMIPALAIAADWVHPILRRNSGSVACSLNY